jgi:hypothetical protein
MYIIASIVKPNSSNAALKHHQNSIHFLSGIASWEFAVQRLKALVGSSDW